MLGLPSTADRETIKKAFRGLAQEYHPDVSADPEAESRFREIVEAYEALTRPLERVATGRERRGGGVRRARPRQRGRAKSTAEVTVPYLESVRGVEREVEFTVDETCRSCRGEGMAPGAVATVCRACDGDGWVRTVSRSAAGRWIQVEACGDCAGAGVVFSASCDICNGNGRVAVQRKVRVDIPAGVRDGARIPVSGVVVPEGMGQSGEATVLVRVQRPPDARAVRLFAAVGVVLAIVLLVLMLHSL